MRVLIVESEKSLAHTMAYILFEQRFKTDVADNCALGLSLAKSNGYDCIILDSTLDFKGAYELLSVLRQNRILTPVVLIVGKRASQKDSAHLAELCLEKPFSKTELVSAVKALTCPKGSAACDVLSFDDLCFCTSTLELKCMQTSKSICLSQEENKIISMLLSHALVIVPTEALVDCLGSRYPVGIEASVDVYISFLKRKLRFIGSRVDIEAYKNGGYRLI